MSLEPYSISAIGMHTVDPEHEWDFQDVTCTYDLWPYNKLHVESHHKSPTMGSGERRVTGKWQEEQRPQVQQGLQWETSAIPRT